MDLVISIEAIAHLRRWWDAYEDQTSYTMASILDDLYTTAKSAAAAWSILGDDEIRDAHFDAGPIIALRLASSGDLERPDQINVIDLRVG